MYTPDMRFSLHWPDAIIWVYVPGLSVRVPPLQLTEPRLAEVGGGAREANGSATGAAPVDGRGLKLGLPVALTPPTTSMRVAAMCGFPFADSAAVQFELTCTGPGISIFAFPVIERASQA